MTKKYKIVSLPTEKALGLPMLCIKNCSGGDVGHMGYCYYLSVFNIGGKYWEPQHLYVVSDDKIKEGDSNYYIFYNSSNINERGIYFVKNVIIEDFGVVYSDKRDALPIELCKKIVASTNESLYIGKTTSDYIKEDKYKNFPEDVPDYTGKQLLPILPDSFVLSYVRAYNTKNPITEVELEMETGITGEPPFEQYAKGIKIDAYGLVIPFIKPNSNDENKIYTKIQVETLISKFNDEAHTIATEEDKSVLTSRTLKKWLSENL